MTLEMSRRMSRRKFLERTWKSILLGTTTTLGIEAGWFAREALSPGVPLQLGTPELIEKGVFQAPMTKMTVKNDENHTVDWVSPFNNKEGNGQNPLTKEDGGAWVIKNSDRQTVVNIADILPNSSQSHEPIRFTSVAGHLIAIECYEDIPGREPDIVERNMYIIYQKQGNWYRTKIEGDRSMDGAYQVNVSFGSGENNLTDIKVVPYRPVEQDAAHIEIS